MPPLGFGRGGIFYSFFLGQNCPTPKIARWSFIMSNVSVQTIKRPSFLHNSNRSHSLQFFIFKTSPSSYLRLIFLNNQVFSLLLFFATLLQNRLLFPCRQTSWLCQCGFRANRRLSCHLHDQQGSRRTPPACRPTKIPSSPLPVSRIKNGVIKPFCVLRRSVLVVFDRRLFDPLP